MRDFHLTTHAQEIIFGSGSLAQLAGAVERSGWQRLMLCSSPALRRAGQVDTLRAALGSRLVAIFDRVQPHVQDYQLAEVVAIAVEQGVEAIIGLGGGSPVGMAKAASAALRDRPGDHPPVAVIAIPTTYAGSEMTPVYGVTHHGQNPPRKITDRDPRTTPRLVIYDPDLTLALPPGVTASSGINALAHCVEALYSIRRNPLATAAAQAAIQHIAHALPRCTEDGSDHDARGEVMAGSHLAGLALSLTAMGLHHGLCHVLGGSASVPHGIANSVILPHAMRFNLEAATPELALVARSMGRNADGQGERAAAETAVEAVFQFVGGLGLPQRLHDAGVAESDLPRLAQLALHSRAVQDNPRPVTGAAEIEAVLRAAW